ncbi:MAG: 2-vinyl bacteriochlorophyllide hydratase [Pseudomonadota bacterium]
MRTGAQETRPKAFQLYTAEQRGRRDASAWTTVQGVLAPLQFVVFLVSLGLVTHFLMTGEGWWAATVSIVVKTLILYAIMVTGSIWEKVVFGRYLFAPAFFWEDVFSMLVLALHTAYLATLVINGVSANTQMMIALAAYAAYVINAAQFVWKLRLARLSDPAPASHAAAESASVSSPIAPVAAPVGMAEAAR